MKKYSTLFIFSKYSYIGASSRYRTYQYLPALKEAGVTCKIFPLFGDDYLRDKYSSGRGSLGSVLRAFMHRLWAVLMVPKGGVVLIEYELLPFCPAWLEIWLVRRNCRLIVDYDDALFHKYDRHPHPLVRNWFGKKISNVMKMAHIIVVGNSYLADYARKEGAVLVELIPTVVDLMRYLILRPKFRPSLLTIGWIGSPTTAKYLQDIAPALAQVCAGGRGVVRLIGSGKVNLPDVPVEVVPWDESTEVAELQKLDIGIMPLPDEPWERGKCGFKLIQYMACGLPVVGSPVGVNCEIIDQGVNGYLAATHTEWVMALNALLADAELRQRMGSAGRKQVEQLYSLQVTGPKFAELITSVADGS